MCCSAGITLLPIILLPEKESEGERAREGETRVTDREAGMEGGTKASTHPFKMQQRGGGGKELKESQDSGETMNSKPFCAPLLSPVPSKSHPD